MMLKKFKLCPHGEMYSSCPLCKDNISESHIEHILEEGIGRDVEEDNR